MKWFMNDCCDLYVNILWVDMHDKYMILEIIWWNGQEPWMIHELIWLQILTTLYDERYVVIMLMTKWWMIYAQWEFYELQFSTWLCTLCLPTCKRTCVVMDKYLMLNCITCDIKGLLTVFSSHCNHDTDKWSWPTV